MKLGVSVSLTATAALLLGACSSLPSVPNPFGQSEEDKQVEAAERAQRVPLVAIEAELAADPDLASIEVYVPTAEAIQDWPQSGGSAHKAVGHILAAESFQIDWKKSIVKGSSRRKPLVSPPVASDGVIYLIDSNQNVSALSGDTGSRIWEERLEPPRKRDKVGVGGGVAVAGETLIVTSGYGYILGLNKSNGSQIWKIDTQAPVTGAPTIDGDYAYVTSSNNELYVVRISDGEILWSDQAIAENARVLSAPSPAVGGDLLIAPFSSGEIIAYLPANGRRVWSDSLTRGGKFTPISAINDIAGRPVISDGAVIAVSQSGIMASVDLMSGTRRWSKAFGSIQTPAVAGSYIFSINTDSQLACIDKIDGRVVWVTQLAAHKNEKKRKDKIVWSGPVVASDKIIAASSDGKLISVNPQTGEITETLKIGEPVYIEPIIANGRVYVLTDGGKLVAVR